MIISAMVASAALMSPVDVAQTVSELSEPQGIVSARGEELKDAGKFGASVNYTYSYVGGTGTQSMDDANSWD